MVALVVLVEKEEPRQSLVFVFCILIRRGGGGNTN